MKETDHACVILSCSLNHEGDEKYKKKEWGFFTIGLFSKWQPHSSHPWTWHLFESSSLCWFLSFLGSIPVIQVRYTPMACYSSSHHGEFFNASCVVALYSSRSCVLLPSHHGFVLYVQGKFKLESTIYCFVDFPSRPSLCQLYFSPLSSHHLLVSVSYQLMRDKSRPSFNGSLPIDFNTLYKTRI